MFNRLVEYVQTLFPLNKRFLSRQMDYLIHLYNQASLNDQLCFISFLSTAIENSENRLIELELLNTFEMTHNVSAPEIGKATLNSWRDIKSDLEQRTKSEIFKIAQETQSY